MLRDSKKYKNKSERKKLNKDKQVEGEKNTHA